MPLTFLARAIHIAPVPLCQVALIVLHLGQALLSVPHKRPRVRASLYARCHVAVGVAGETLGPIVAVAGVIRFVMAARLLDGF